MDACKLKEEDCFLYLSKRYGRYSEASRGREARGEALAHLKDFLQKAEQKGLVPDWWSNENTSELCRAAQVPNNPYHLKLIKLGEPMTTATESRTHWTRSHWMLPRPQTTTTTVSATTQIQTTTTTTRLTT